MTLQTNTADRLVGTKTRHTHRGCQAAQGSSLFLLQDFPALERLTGRLKGERSTPASSILRSSATRREQ